MADIESGWLLRAYGFSLKGILPNKGGWLDQTNMVCEAIEYITHQLNMKDKDNGAEE